jgi:hypothetical protein
MKYALALVPLLACNADWSPPPVAPATGPLAPISDGRGGWYAVLAPVAVQSDVASNLGGDHLTLRVVEHLPDTPHLIHAGGHGKFLSMHCSDRFVAHIIKPATPIKIFESEVAMRVWVLGDLPSYDGAIIEVARVAPGEDLAARLARAAREGLPGTPAAPRSGDWLDRRKRRGVWPADGVGHSCYECAEREDDAVFGVKYGPMGTGADVSCPVSA